MPRIEMERVDVERAEDRSDSSSERFDRLAFAERAVALVRPPHTRVAICEGSRRVQVTSGRQWGANLDARWVILSVPRDASRRAIARAVLDLTDARVELGDEAAFARDQGSPPRMIDPYRGSSRAFRLD